jgi:hypothetical protein
MKPVKIQVKKIDIRRGKRSSGNLCPIARSIKRQIKGCTVFVGEEEIDLVLPGNSFTNFIHMPVKAIDFVMRFDEGLTVKPISFVLKSNS